MISSIASNKTRGSSAPLQIEAAPEMKPGGVFARLQRRVAGNSNSNTGAQINNGNPTRIINEIKQPPLAGFRNNGGDNIQNMPLFGGNNAIRPNGEPQAQGSAREDYNALGGVDRMSQFNAEGVGGVNRNVTFQEVSRDPYAPVAAAGGAVFNPNSDTFDRTTAPITFQQQFGSQHSAQGQPFQTAGSTNVQERGINKQPIIGSASAPRQDDEHRITGEFLRERSRALETCLNDVDQSVEKAKHSQKRALEMRGAAESVYQETRHIMEEFIEGWNRQVALAPI